MSAYTKDEYYHLAFNNDKVVTGTWKSEKLNQKKALSPSAKKTEIAWLKLPETTCNLDLRQQPVFTILACLRDVQMGFENAF
jgi:hypothetical protein